MFKPEILAPAGDLERLRTAFLYGADACYMGVKSMSMRVKIDDEGGDALEEALKLKNELGKKLYVTMNIHAHENKLNFLDKELDRLVELHKKGLDPDGILASDSGIAMLIQERCPWIDLHVSTQANILNSAAIEFWAKLGATRVVLGREVSLRELQQIREKLNERGVNVELEGFVHGAMCMAYSGRCLLSNFMAYRDANEGMCAQCCRWKYQTHKVEPKKIEDPKGTTYYLEEEQRPGVLMPIEEDDNGTSIMSAKDMCMAEHLKDLIDVKLDSLKIEGRHKTPYYTAIATKIYRQGLDLAMEGKKPTKEIIDLIESINTRGYFTGFWYGKPGAEGQNYEDRNNYNENYCYAGIIREVNGNEVIMELKNRLDKGDKLDIITPDKNIPIVLDEFYNAKNNELIEVGHAGQSFTIKFNIDGKVEVGYVVRKKFETRSLKLEE